MRCVSGRGLVALVTFAVGVCAALALRGQLLEYVRRERAAGGCGECAERRVLLDMRVNVRGHDLPDEEFKKDGEMLVAVNRRVLPEVFPRGYLEGTHSECADFAVRKMAESPADLEWARAGGYFVPRVSRWRTGSLTEPRADETLYQIDVRECNAQSGPLAYGSTQLAVYRGRALRNSFNTLFGSVVYVVPDVDGDGVDEVLMSRHEHDGPSGDAERFRLLSLKGGGLRVVHDFGAVGGHYRWDEARKVYEIEVGVLSYAPGRGGRPPDFRTELYRGRCHIEPNTSGIAEPDNCWPRPSEWEYVGRAGADGREED